MGLIALQNVRSSWFRDQTCVPCIGKQIFFFFATEPPRKPLYTVLYHAFHFLEDFFFTWAILKVIIESVTISLLVSFLCFGVFWPGGLWDLNSLTRGGTHAPCTGKWSPNHWTTG